MPFSAPTAARRRSQRGKRFGATATPMVQDDSDDELESNKNQHLNTGKVNYVFVGHIFKFFTVLKYNVICSQRTIKHLNFTTRPL